MGIIYRQFSIAMVTSIGFSALLALTLTPALCATLLKPIEKGHGHSKGGVFGWFNRVVDRETARYGRGVAGMIKRSGRVMMVYLALVIGLGFAFVRMPEGFLPVEGPGLLHRGYPDAARLVVQPHAESREGGGRASPRAARRRHGDDRQRLLVLRPGPGDEPGLRDLEAMG